MELAFSFCNADSGAIDRCWFYRSLLWRKLMWIFSLLRKLCMTFLLPVAATPVILLLMKPPLLPIVRSFCPLFVSTLFFVLAFLGLTGHRAQRAKLEQREIDQNKSTVNKAACTTAINGVDRNWSAQKTKEEQQRVETYEFGRQEERPKPACWVDYVRGRETSDPNSIWFLEKKRTAEFSSQDNLGSVSVDTGDFSFNQSTETPEEEHVVLMKEVGQYLQILFLKLRADGILKEETIESGIAKTADQSDVKPEQGTGASATMASVTNKSSLSFFNARDQSKGVDIESSDHSEDDDGSSSNAWERTLDTSEDGSSSSAASQRGSDTADHAYSAIELTNESYSGWKLTDTTVVISDHQHSLIPDSRFRSSVYHRRFYSRQLAAHADSPGWDSDESVDPYVMLFAESCDSGVDDRSENLSQPPVGNSDSGQCDRLVEPKIPAYQKSNLSARRRISSKKSMDRSKNVRSLSSVCKAVRNFLRRIHGGRKIRF